MKNAALIALSCFVAGLSGGMLYHLTSEPDEKTKAKIVQDYLANRPVDIPVYSEREPLKASFTKVANDIREPN